VSRSRYETRAGEGGEDRRWRLVELGRSGRWGRVGGGRREVGLGIDGDDRRPGARSQLANVSEKARETPAADAGRRDLGVRDRAQRRGAHG